MTYGPTLMRWVLARELRRMREAAGLHTTDAALALRCVPPRITHLEGGRTVPRYPDLALLCTLYGAETRIEELDVIRQAANQRGWWSEHQLPPWLKTYLG
ncbi:MAG: helix-turn-helix domain-containing protein, partial [Pseudonocardiaceae bacterium]